MELEKRLEINEEIYGIFLGDEISFIHEDTTTYTKPITIKVSDLVTGNIFDYALIQLDIFWIREMFEKIAQLD